MSINTFKKENIEILQLVKQYFIKINNFFEATKYNKLNDLSDLANEFILVEIIREMYYELTHSDPSIEENYGKIEPSKNDNNFVIKYFNLLAIVKCFSNYLEKHPDKYRLLPSTDFNDSIRVRDIINENNEHLIQLGEAIIVLTTFSPKKDEFLDCLSNFDESLQYYFLRVLEKYIVMINEEDESDYNLKHDSEIVKEEIDYIIKDPKLKKRGSISRRHIQSFKRKNNIENKNYRNNYIKEKEFSEFVKSVEIEMMDIMKKLNESENRRIDMEVKLDQMTKENEELRNVKAAENIYERSVELNKVKKQLDDKIDEMEKSKIEVDKEFKKYLNEIEKLQTINLKFNEKLESYKKIEEENSILKIKIIELDKLKEIKKEYEKLVKDYQKQYGETSYLKKELKDVKPILESLRKEIIIEKEKLTSAISEKRKYETELLEVKNYNRKLEKKHSKEIDNKPKKTLPDQERKDNITMEMSNIDNVSSYLEKINFLEIENKTLKLEKMQILSESEERLDRMNKLIEQIDKLAEEKGEIIKYLEILRNENEVLNEKNREIEKERNMLEEEIQVINIELQKYINLTEKNRNNNTSHKEEIKILENKLKFHMIEKEILNKELESLKNQVTNNRNYIKCLEKENLILVNKNQNIQLDYENKIIELNLCNNKIKQLTANSIKKVVTPTKFDSDISSMMNDMQNLKLDVVILKKENAELESFKNQIINLKKEIFDLCYLRKEIENIKNENNWLKNIINQKEEILSKVKEDLNQLEKDNESITSKLEENLSIYNEQLFKKNEEILFLKESYKEQKKRIELEHEMLSNSLYEMSLHFISLRNDMLGKFN